MSSEKIKQNSEHFGATEEFFAEMGTRVSEAWLLPETLLGRFIEDALGNFEK